MRQLLELRRTGARAAVNKFKRMLAYASPVDDRMRGTLRMYGAGPGRWAGLGPQLQNLKKNESSLPLTWSIPFAPATAAALPNTAIRWRCSATSRAPRSAPAPAWSSNPATSPPSSPSCWPGSPASNGSSSPIRPFSKPATRRSSPIASSPARCCSRPADAEISTAERQLGKGAELASGFGGSVGAWRRIMPHDPRSDDEIKAIIKQWRDAHPATRKFWNDLARTIRVAIRTGQPILVAPAPQPPIVAAFADGNLTLTLPSGRAITYPEARLIPAKFEDAPPDVQFMDNARGQWKPYRGWFGTFVENVVQGTARDLLAAAIERFETRGIDVVFHCHDEVTVEVPIGSLSDEEFLTILLKLPDWATGLPLGGKVHSGPHYLAPPEQAAEPLVSARIPTTW